LTVVASTASTTDTANPTAMPATRKTPLKEIAARIDAHLKRFQNDPAINRYKRGTPEQMKSSGPKPYYNAGAFVGGAYVRVIYIGYQGASSLRRSDAEAYLAKLDAGFVGRHYEALREA
jgi:hypothetical protein